MQRKLAELLNISVNLEKAKTNIVQNLNLVTYIKDTFFIRTVTNEELAKIKLNLINYNKYNGDSATFPVRIKQLCFCKGVANRLNMKIPSMMHQYIQTFGTAFITNPFELYISMECACVQIKLITFIANTDDGAGYLPTLEKCLPKLFNRVRLSCKLEGGEILTETSIRMINVYMLNTPRN